MTRQLNLDELDGHFGDDEPEEDILDSEEGEAFYEDEDLEDEVEFDFEIDGDEV